MNKRHVLNDDPCVNSHPSKYQRHSNSTLLNSPENIPNGWSVHKFGGKSLTSADCYRKVCNLIIDQILKAPTKRICVVVSAMGSHRACKDTKVTDMIINCFSLAVKQDDSYLTLLQSLIDKHIDIVHDLFAGHTEIMEKVERVLHHYFEDFKFVLRNARLSKYISPNSWSFGYGEIWSTCVLTSYLNTKLSKRKAVFLDGREVIHIFPDCDIVNMDPVKSLQKLRQWYSHHLKKDSNDVIMLTGYLASDSTGKPTTLGRAGSDYSAAIMANLLNADSLTVWTDVDGVYSADPRIVEGAQLQESLSYREAAELVHFGVKVMHPKTMSPLINQKIPIWVKNSFNPQQVGTCIQHTNKKPSIYGVVGFSYIPDLSLVSIGGCGMIAVPGVASRFFHALNQKCANVVMISQSGSKHSICCAVPRIQADDCVKSLLREFRDELDSGTCQTVEKSENICACLAVVGDGMKTKEGIAGRMFCALGNAEVNIIALALGRTARNLSTIVPQDDAQRALIAVHNAFFNEPFKSLISLSPSPKKSIASKTLEVPSILDDVQKTVEKNQEESNLQTKYAGIKEEIRILNEEADEIMNTLNTMNAN